MNSQPIVLQVSELAAEMRQLLERSYPEVWVEGELSSLSSPASGHLYFTLKDDQSQLRCAMFRNRASISRYRPQAGDLVRVRAKISVYTARGDLQCIVQHIEAAGEGQLQRRFEELKRELNAAGLFAQEHKREMPGFARHIGLITSPTGAAVRDILTTLKRRAPSIPVTIYPAVVQGESAAQSLIEALQNAVQHDQCDVLILSRGGGSLEDLWCFNDADLAQAIFACPIPVVAGVGHEVDITIADLVADQRAPTPTAAAELLSPDRTQLQNNLISLSLRLPRSLRRQLEQLAQQVDTCFQQLQHPREQISRQRERITQLQHQLRRSLQQQLSAISQTLKQQHLQLRAHSPTRTIAAQRSAVQAQFKQLCSTAQHQLHNTRARHAALAEQLNAVSPLATLARGYAIARDAKGTILRSTKQVQNRQQIEVQLHQGNLLCDVVDIKP
ncbi:MAG: exodeoxyribonuclease VII large subunit [Gammaproteobacteria bacterium]|nr:exodeoxyribonuclease VII large subunit [Gammaproteobacteria bacterium]